jgi:hypothetical protein
MACLWYVGDAGAVFGLEGGSPVCFANWFTIEELGSELGDSWLLGVGEGDRGGELDACRLLDNIITLQGPLAAFHFLSTEW